MVKPKWFILSCILLGLICLRCGQVKLIESSSENITEIENEVDMKLSLVLFQPWNEENPLQISKHNHEGGFIQVGPKTFTLRRPKISLKLLNGHLVAFRFDTPDAYLWEGSEKVQSAPFSASDHQLGRFDQVLLANEGKVLALASGQDLYVQEKESRSREVRLRGLSYSENGQLSLGIREDETVQILTSAPSKMSFQVGAETPGEGPWTLYSDSGDTTILIANHLALQRFSTDGNFISKSPLSDDVYEQELFPRSWNIESIAAESLQQVLISFTGPTGFGIGRLTF